MAARVARVTVEKHAVLVIFSHSTTPTTTTTTSTTKRPPQRLRTAGPLQMCAEYAVFFSVGVHAADTRDTRQQRHDTTPLRACDTLHIMHIIHDVHNMRRARSHRSAITVNGRRRCAELSVPERIKCVLLATRKLTRHNNNNRQHRDYRAKGACAIGKSLGYCHERNPREIGFK